METYNARIYRNLFWELLKSVLRQRMRLFILFTFKALVFLAQIVLPFLILLLLGGGLADRVPQYIPNLSTNVSLTTLQLLIAIIVVTTLRALMLYGAQKSSLKIRKGIEISLAQAFVDTMMSPPLTDRQEFIREKVLSKGPSVMMMGSKEAGIVGLLIAGFLVEIPFICIYTLLLVLWFPAEFLWMSVPMVFALVIVIMSIVKFKVMSLAFMTSFPKAISERRALWQKFPRKQSDHVSEQSDISNLMKGDTALQYESFYRRHFRSLDINFVFALMLIVTIATGIFTFYQRVLNSEAVLGECIILFALGRFLFAGLSIGISMLTTFSRNFESIRRVFVPLMPPSQGGEAEFEEAGAPMGVFAEDDEDDLEIPVDIKHLSVLTLNRGTFEMRKNVFAVLYRWPISVDSVLTRDYFPKPLPKSRSKLVALGKAFPENSIFSARMHHHRKELNSSWKIIFKAMKDSPILNICHTAEQVMLARELGFDYVAVTGKRELVEFIDLTENSEQFLETWS